MTMKYYVRVKIGDKERFESYIKDNEINADHLSTDIGSNPGVMYAVQMDAVQAMAMNLSFPLIGCLNFHKTMEKSCGSSSNKVKSD